MRYYISCETDCGVETYYVSRYRPSHTKYSDGSIIVYRSTRESDWVLAISREMGKKLFGVDLVPGQYVRTKINTEILHSKQWAIPTTENKHSRIPLKVA